MHECAVATVAQQLLIATIATLLSSQLLPAVVAQIGLPGCPTNCGNVSVPYPFGITPECYLEGFNLTCDTSSSPPRLLLGKGTLQLVDIFVHNSTMRVLGPDIQLDTSRNLVYGWGNGTWGGPGWGLGDGGPYSLSEWHNEFILLGCFFFGELWFAGGDSVVTNCGSVCNLHAILPDEDRNGKKCSGIGCCQVPIPIGRSSYDVHLKSNRIWDPYESAPYAVLIAEEGWFDQNMIAKALSDGVRTPVPVVLSWAVPSIMLRLQGPNETRDGNTTCPADLGNTTICHSSYSSCTSMNRRDTDHYYTCKCWDGYQGNPYLPQGCQDIDECALPDKCYGSCTNIPSSYLCECPHGTHGDPYIKYGCVQSHEGLSIGLGIGSGAALLFIVLGTTFLIHKVKSQRKRKLRQRFFNQNRGQLLQQLVCQRTDIAERMIITLKELEKATNDFDKVREIGGGGHGTVYKGILSSLHVVAIKKSKIVVQREINDFINEVAILSQLNHRNIVKLLGCCLETEVPLLVYEFITNGTLYHHLHVEAPLSLSWKDRLRIGVETARALAYLHSFVSLPIVHRDIKSPNILLDDNLRVKLSDFGASRYIPMDQMGLDTVVQGTFGYLDPMYYSTGHLTEKSDVYSFGVILIELLTRKKPVSYRSVEGYGLVKHFVTLLSEVKLDHILDPQVTREGGGEVIDVALLAAICVKFTSEERPTMRQVEMTLESIYEAKECVSSDTTDEWFIGWRN